GRQRAKQRLRHRPQGRRDLPGEAVLEVVQQAPQVVRFHRACTRPSAQGLVLVGVVLLGPLKMRHVVAQALLLGLQLRLDGAQLLQLSAQGRRLRLPLRDVRFQLFALLREAARLAVASLEQRRDPRQFGFVDCLGTAVAGRKLGRADLVQQLVAAGQQQRQLPVLPGGERNAALRLTHARTSARCSISPNAPSRRRLSEIRPLPPAPARRAGTAPGRGPTRTRRGRPPAPPADNRRFRRCRLPPWAGRSADTRRPSTGPPRRQAPRDGTGSSPPTICGRSGAGRSAPPGLPAGCWDSRPAGRGSGPTGRSRSARTPPRGASGLLPAPFPNRTRRRSGARNTPPSWSPGERARRRTGGSSGWPDRSRWESPRCRPAAGRTSLPASPIPPKPWLPAGPFRAPRRPNTRALPRCDETP